MPVLKPCESATTFVSTAVPISFIHDKSKLVTLLEGEQVQLAELSFDELLQLQCEQEPAFARRIAGTKKASPERAAAIRHAYETVCAILDQMSQRKVAGQTLSMGMDVRYKRFVLDLLAGQRSRGIDGGVFELGFGSGIFLQAASDAGHRVGGLEVSSPLFEETKSKLPVSSHSNLWLGNFCSIDFGSQRESYSLAYWNDVFEHIPVDEIGDYLRALYGLLKPGGKLITITPNWHMRPSDVTALFQPRRTEAIGFHLKEYTLREVRQLLLEAGFTSVRTPLFISPNRFYYSSFCDVTQLKSILEPLLEYLPIQVAIQMCRRFGLNCTVATKGS